MYFLIGFFTYVSLRMSFNMLLHTFLYMLLYTFLYMLFKLDNEYRSF